MRNVWNCRDVVGKYEYLLEWSVRAHSQIVYLEIMLPKLTVSKTQDQTNYYIQIQDDLNF